jgi:hypothetical protein
MINYISSFHSLAAQALSLFERYVVAVERIAKALEKNES